MVWALPRPVDDLFVALAGGRDILAGRLGQPDDWAFTTHGRVWLDQNWGTHALLYLAYSALGESGLLIQKALMLVGTAGFLVLACRSRGIRFPAALLVAGAAIAAGRSYIDLRPNLTSIALTPLLLWMLYRTYSRRHGAWAATLVVWLWSNAHGGFVLGIALMALWTASCALETIRDAAPGRSRLWDRIWPLLAATGAAVLVAAVANPFGIANITHPLVVAREPIWRQIDEWRPLLASSATPFGTEWEFLIVVALWLGALLARTLGSVARRDGASRVMSLAVFDIASGVLVILMVLQARRFVPLAVLVLAPPIAMQLDAILAGARSRALLVAIAAALLVPPALLARPLVMRYRSDNPLYDRETMLQRMVVTSPFFPAKAAAFINANGLGGPALNAWEWEGFLRWQGTRLRFFAGSRAQQVYDAATYSEWLRLLNAEDSPPAALTALAVHLAIIPMTPRYNALLSALVYEEDSHWVFVYSDGLHVVLADTTWNGNAELVAAAAHGSLSYPSEGARALSVALCLASPASHARADAIRDALQNAVGTQPSGLAYAALGDLATTGRMPLQAAIAYFEAETQRLATIDSTGAGGAAVLEARQWAAAVLANLYRATGRIQDASHREAEARALTADLERLKTKWGWGDTPGFS